MQYSEVKNLPVRYRRWFVERLAKHFAAKNHNTEKQNSSVDPKLINVYDQQVSKHLAKNSNKR